MCGDSSDEEFDLKTKPPIKFVKFTTPWKTTVNGPEEDDSDDDLLFGDSRSRSGVAKRGRGDQGRGLRRGVLSVGRVSVGIGGRGGERGIKRSVSGGKKRGGRGSGRGGKGVGVGQREWDTAERGVSQARVIKPQMKPKFTISKLLNPLDRQRISLSKLRLSTQNERCCEIFSLFIVHPMSRTKMVTLPPCEMCDSTDQHFCSSCKRQVFTLPQ